MKKTYEKPTALLVAMGNVQILVGSNIDVNGEDQGEHEPGAPELSSDLWDD